MNNKKNRVLTFFKKYGYYAMAFILVVGISLGILFTNLTPAKTSTQPVNPTGGTTISFALPVDSPQVLKGYSDTELLYNSTLKQWESHKGVDLTSQNVNVSAVADGIISEINSNYENGTLVKITHADGFVSSYSSLDSDMKIAVGDKITKGTTFAKMSSTASNESGDGVHLHFELYKDGEKVDPANYLSLEIK